MSDEKKVVLKQAHDRTLGGVIGSLVAYLAIRALGLEPSPEQNMTIYGAATTLGTQIGAYVPEQYRKGLWAAGAFVLTLLGVS